MARIARLTFTEVVVPARAEAINSQGSNRPLHKLASVGQASWTKQFDELPKCLVELELTDGTIGLGNFIATTIGGFSKVLPSAGWGSP